MNAKPTPRKWTDVQLTITAISMTSALAFWNMFAGPDRSKADEKAVAVHVRRGDYLKPAINAFHGLLPIKYYENARVKLETTIDNPNYYIFSDDIEWCKLNFKFRNSTFISDKGTANWEDMCLMSLCKHNIIANSSYSWWSAWLNTNPDKIVIAPEQWFAKQTSEIVPEKWLKI